jgi:ABC-type lipoprotein release transport system permease subunit
MPVGRWARVLLVAAIAAVAGLAVATMVGGAQAAGALDRFVAWSHPIEAAVVADPTTPMVDQAHVLAPVAHLPSVVASMRVAIIVVSVRARPTAAPAPMVGYDDIDRPSTSMFRLRVVSGRLARADRPDEVTVNEALADRLHLHVGERFEVSTYAASEVDQLGNGIVPRTPRSTVALRVVGIVRTPGDLESHPEAQPGTPYEFNSSRFYATPAFWAREGAGAAGYGVQDAVRVAGGDLSALSRNLHRTHFGAPVGVEPGNPELSDRASLARSTGVESAALWILGCLIAVVGAMLVGPALRRSVALSAERRSSLSALGFGRADLTLLEVRRALPVVGLGALLSIPVAVVVSPWASFGTSGRAELGDGVVVRPAFLAVGALVVVAVLTGVVVIGAWADSQRRVAPRPSAPRPDRLSSAVAARSPLALATATRLVVPAGGRNRGAVRSAVVAVALGVALLVGALAFSASMRDLVDSPGLRGWTWDVEVGNYSRPTTSAAAARFLEGDRDVAAWSGFKSAQVRGPAGKVDLVGVDDPEAIRLVALSGRLPRRDGEVALTPHTLSLTHRHVGDRIVLRAERTRTLRIVGTTVGPGSMETDMELRDGGVVVLSELGRLGDPNHFPASYLVRLRHDVPRRRAIASLRPEFHDTVLGPYATSDVETIRRAEPLPRWFAFGVAVLALGALTYAMGSMLRRNRRDVALLKSLGSDRRGIRSVVLDQAYLIAVPGLVVGIPLGIILSRWAWRLAVGGIGIVTEPVVPWLAVGTVVVGAMATVGAIGLRAAARATRVPVAATLRAE